MKRFILLFLMTLSINIVIAADEVYLKCTYTEAPIYTKEFSPNYSSQQGTVIYKIANNHIYTVDNKEVGDVTDKDVASAYFRYKQGDFIVIESFSINRITGAFINEKSIGTPKDLYIKSQGQGTCQKTTIQNLF